MAEPLEPVRQHVSLADERGDRHRLAGEHLPVDIVQLGEMSGVHREVTLALGCRLDQLPEQVGVGQPVQAVVIALFPEGVIGHHHPRSGRLEDPDRVAADIARWFELPV